MKETSDTQPTRLRRVGHSFVAADGQLSELKDSLAGSSWDMVELDVLAFGDRLVVAHDRHDLELPDLIAFADALETLREILPPNVEINVDLKDTGYEQRVTDVLRSLGLIDRVLISTMEPESLPILRAAAPGLRLGWSVPKVRRNYLAHPLTRPGGYLMLAYLRHFLPRRIGEALRAGVADAIMAHWGVVTPALCTEIRSLGKELYVWTVDDADRLIALDGLEVTGVITNDGTVFERAGLGARGRWD